MEGCESMTLFTGVTKSFQLGAKSFRRLSLKIHELHELVDLGSEHFDRLLVDFDAVRLVVGLDLRDGAGAAAPGVEHLGKLHTFDQHLVHRGVDRRLFDVLGHADDEGATILEIRVEIGL